MAGDNPRPRLVVGLTGGIASGKTAVSDRFAQKGVTVVDTDQLAREVVEPGTVGFEAIRARFGPSVLRADGHLDRQTLRDRVFSKPEERAALEAITHPLIRDRVQASITAAASAYAMVVVPLLVEAGWDKDMDRVLVVDVPESLQRSRLMERDDVDETRARRMIAAQTPRARRLAAADDVIRNTGDLGRLDEAVQRLHEKYQRLAQQNG